MKIKQLKELIQEKTQIEPVRQRIIYQAKEFKDDKTISDYRNL
jgi:hypothetical protein